MPFQNIITQHIDAAKRALIFSLIGQLEALLQPYLHNLSPEENRKLGHINERNKLFVNKVNVYHKTQPALRSPDVDWNEFDADMESRDTYQQATMRLTALVKAMTETRRLHDHDVYRNALLDYQYAKYKDSTEQGTGFDSKLEQLTPLLSASGKRSLTDEL
jgi:hypothetical protein